MPTLQTLRSHLRFSFPVYRQLDAMDCGPTCVRMVARHYGKSLALQTLRDRMFQDRQGVSLLNISYVAESIGFRTLSAKTDWEALSTKAPLPCIVHWNQNHFVVVHRIRNGRVHVADPGEGLVTYGQEEFIERWASIRSEGKRLGIVLLMEPTSRLYAMDDEPAEDRRSLRFLLSYARGYRSMFTQVIVGLLVVSLLQLVFPLLSQALVDHGIGRRDLSFVNVLLIAQLVLVFSRTAVEYLRNRLLFYVGTRIFISVTADFLQKLLRLPVTFFDQRLVGDIMQRVGDNQRIQQFVTTTTLTVAFSTFSLAVFSAVLAYYSLLIFAVFALGSLLYVGYVFLFLPRRREIDFRRFGEQARSHNTIVEIVNGMPEIKVANAEQMKRWDWERIQARLFKLQLQGLSLEQMQEGGGVLINETKNVLVTFLAAKLVIDGSMTLGMLLAVQYIIGQMNGPVAQLVGFVHSVQDARISLERLAEIHERADEEEVEGRLHVLPPRRDIELRNVSFAYGGAGGTPVLHAVDLTIPEGTVTAIVGPSGSGKTTLLRLLLKFYQPTGGELTVGGTRLGVIANRAWRDACGVVMQDGHLFSDTIAGNVALGYEAAETERLVDAVRVANVQDYVERLPVAYGTRIGRDGVGMSQGQKQRLLIARAVYKDPAYLFFDEATSSLDANNERTIMENLRSFFAGRTVVVIAHRLSTVKDADQIVVLDGGRVVERGTHDQLTALRGSYFTLVRNQLELGT
jgi:ATP-binding cassette subfamily B protein